MKYKYFKYHPLYIPSSQYMRAEVATTKSYIDQYRNSLNELRNNLSASKYSGAHNSLYNKSFGGIMGRSEFEPKVQ